MHGWKPLTTAQLLTALAPTHVTRLLISGTKLSEAELMLWCSGDAGRDVTVELGFDCCLHPEGSLARVRQQLLPGVDDDPAGMPRVTLVADEGCEVDE
jgi:hypothetical protein